LVEVFWVAAGRKDAALPAFWNPRLPLFCGDAAFYGGAYGHRLRAYFGVDQLERVSHALEASPDSRQAVLQIWDAASDLPGVNGVPARDDIPCNVTALLKIRGGRLEWMQILRSNDLFLGFPHNVVQFTSLQEMLAGWLGVSVGGYHHLSDSLHVYARDLEAVRGSLVPIPVSPNLDSFALDRPTWDRVMIDVLRRLDAMTQSELVQGALLELALANDTPPAYENAIRIAAADAARRRGWQDVATSCVAACTNPTLVKLWTRWVSRVSRIAVVETPTK
jgi:thymidylate synthase